MEKLLKELLKEKVKTVNTFIKGMKVVVAQNKRTGTIKVTLEDKKNDRYVDIGQVVANKCIECSDIFFTERYPEPICTECIKEAERVKGMGERIKSLGELFNSLFKKDTADCCCDCTKEKTTKKKANKPKAETPVSIKTEENKSETPKRIIRKRGGADRYYNMLKDAKDVYVVDNMEKYLAKSTLSHNLLRVMFDYVARGYSMEAIGTKLNLAPASVYRYCSELRSIGLATYDRGRSRFIVRPEITVYKA